MARLPLSFLLVAFLVDIGANLYFVVKMDKAPAWGLNVVQEIALEQSKIDKPSEPALIEPTDMFGETVEKLTDESKQTESGCSKQFVSHSITASEGFE